MFHRRKPASGVKPFRDGAIDIRRWRARRRLDRLFSGRLAGLGKKTALVLGGLLLALIAAAILIAACWPWLSRCALLVGVLRCVGMLAAVWAPCVAALVPIRFLTKVPSFVFRKAMHTSAFAAVALMILSAGDWRAAALTSALAAAAAHLLLAALEDEPWYGRLLVQKSRGEVRRSLTLYFAMVAALIAVCWGAFRRPVAAAAAILMWGAGDAAAALVGIPFGRHKVPLADGKKSWEGSAAMLAVSFAAGLCALLAFEKAGLPGALVSAGMGALLGAAAELFSPGEYDTVTVPAVIAAALLLSRGAL